MTSTSPEDRAASARQRAPARHARAADEVGVREWAELLVERGEQLLARAKHQPRKYAPEDGDSRRHRRR